MGAFVVVWRFRVADDRREEFERAYGPDGDWALLFRKAAGYIGTTLMHANDESGVYLTIDTWATRAAFASFREEWRNEYSTLDVRCSVLTTEESKIGEFETVGTLPSGKS